jgi:hypothetical protein
MCDEHPADSADMGPESAESKNPAEILGPGTMDDQNGPHDANRRNF